LFNLPALRRAYCTAQSTCSGIFDHSTPPQHHTTKVRINPDFFFQSLRYLFNKKEKKEKNDKFYKNEKIQKHIIIYPRKSVIYEGVYYYWKKWYSHNHYDCLWTTIYKVYAITILHLKYKYDVPILICVLKIYYENSSNLTSLIFIENQRV